MAGGFKIGRALRHRNFRLYFAGQGISTIGSWLSVFATSWMAYRLTGSAFILGLVGFCAYAPTSIIAPFAGVLVDRWDQRRTVVITQVMAMLQVASLATFALTGTMTVWHLMAFGTVQAVINAFDMPARQILLRQLVDDPVDLPNAIALNSTLINAARLVGPAVAAMLVGLFGEGWCFAIDAVSYCGVIGSLLAIRVPKRVPRVRDGTVLSEMRDGLAYLMTNPLIRGVMFLLAVSCILVGSYASLLPIVATDVFGGGPYTLGILMGSAGLGALSGALFMANRTSLRGLIPLLSTAAVVPGVGLCALELGPSIWLATPILFIVGVSTVIQFASTTILLQSIVDQAKLSRVLSLLVVVMYSGFPLGALLEGAVASEIGPIHTYCGAGAISVLVAVRFRRGVPQLRASPSPRAIELGIFESAPS